MRKMNKKLPDSPGVYFFKKGRKILYIGKATSLRNRVKSYFNRKTVDSRGPVIGKMISLATSVAFRKTGSVLEAIILEAELIKRHRPRFNSREKDDKSFSHVVITKEKFPRILQIRGRTLSGGKNHFEIRKVFGPFPSTRELRDALRITRKIFPFRDKCLLAESLANTSLPNNNPCFNFQIGLCPGVCIGAISEVNYKKQIKKIELFLSGKKKAVIRALKWEMISLAKDKKFEEAGDVKQKIFILEHIQDVGLLKREINEPRVRIEAYDVAHQDGDNNVGAMVTVEDGEAKKGEYRKFKIRGDSGGDDLKSLREVLERRLNHPEWRFPDLFVVDGSKLQLGVARGVLKKGGFTVPVVSVVKDEKHKPKNILGDSEMIQRHSPSILLANFEAHNFATRYFRKLANRIE